MCALLFSFNVLLVTCEMACPLLCAAPSLLPCLSFSERQGLSPCSKIIRHASSKPSSIGYGGSVDKHYSRQTSVSCCKKEIEELESGGGGAGGVETRASPSSSSSLSSCIRINRTIHSGETLVHAGAVIIQGDVYNGARIYADGDIIVLGKLEGEAHAGRSGDTCAVVFACQMKATCMSIAGCVTHTIPPNPHFCEVASLVDGEIRIHQAVDRSSNLQMENGVNLAKGQTMEGGDKSWLISNINTIRKPAKVAIYTGAYIFVLGVALFLFPRTLFGLLFDLESVSRVWIRVGAVLAMVFGVYYIGTALGDSRGYNGADSFYVSTVFGRIVWPHFISDHFPEFLVAGGCRCCSIPSMFCWPCELDWCIDNAEKLAKQRRTLPMVDSHDKNGLNCSSIGINMHF